jgi:hypothetical protein
MEDYGIWNNNGMNRGTRHKEQDNEGILNKNGMNREQGIKNKTTKT